MNYFRDNYATLNLFRVLLVIFALIAVVSPLVTMMILKEDKTILIMDQAGNFHLTAGHGMRDAKKLQLQCVTAAVTALLTRTPDGYLYKDLLYQSFTRNCDEYLVKHLEDTKKEFELKNIRQIPEIKKTHILNQGNGRYLVHVKIYLTRACQYQNVKFVENLELIVTFLMIENPDISANGRLPLAVMEVVRFELRKLEAQK